MGVTSFQQSLYEFFDSGLLFRIALLQKTILFLLFLRYRHSSPWDFTKAVIPVEGRNLTPRQVDCIPRLSLRRI